MADDSPKKPQPVTADKVPTVVPPMQESGCFKDSQDDWGRYMPPMIIPMTGDIMGAWPIKKNEE